MVGTVDPLRSVVVATVPLTAVVVVIEPAAKTVVAVVVWLGRVKPDPLTDAVASVSAVGVSVL
jgi:hypothetical protein